MPIRGKPRSKKPVNYNLWAYLGVRSSTTLWAIFHLILLFVIAVRGFNFFPENHIAIRISALSDWFILYAEPLTFFFFFIAYLILINSLSVSAQLSITQNTTRWVAFVWGFKRGFILGIMTLLWVTSFYLIFVIPIYISQKYIFNAFAISLVDAVLVIPRMLLYVGIAFTTLYGWAISNKKGKLDSNDYKPFLQIEPTQTITLNNQNFSVIPKFDKKSLTETFYYSMAILLGFGPLKYEPEGLCKWLSLLEMLVGKMLDVIIIGIGISLVLSRLA